MNDEAKRVRNEYMRDYRIKNPEKMKQIQERYWEKKSAAIECREVRFGGNKND